MVTERTDREKDEGGLVCETVILFFCFSRRTLPHFNKVALRERIPRKGVIGEDCVAGEFEG